MTADRTRAGDAVVVVRKLGGEVAPQPDCTNAVRGDRRMGTSRSQLDRVLDPAYTAVHLDTLIKAASAVGRDLRISLKRLARA